jgi:hypothetical protein
MIWGWLYSLKKNETSMVSPAGTSAKLTINQALNELS